MMEIVKNFNIDYIIQVTFEEKKKQISIKDGVAIFKKKEFLKTDIKNEKDIKINKVYLIYPKDFTFRENIVGNKSHKENSNVYLNHSDEDIGNKIEKLKKNTIKSNKDFNNNEKMNLNNNNSTTDIVDKSKILQIKEEEDINNTEKNKKKKNNSIISTNKKIEEPKNLITNLSSYKNFYLEPKGLINPSVYCFMNTCLQCLSSIPELNYYFYNKKYEKQKKSKKKILKACNAYHEFIISYANNNEIIKPPNSIYSTCHSFLESGRQHDCQEFLRRFLGKIQDELNYNKKYRFEDNISMKDAWSIYREVNPSFIDSVFTGLMTSSVKCLKCSYCSYTYDPFLDLSVSLEKKKKKEYLNDCLKRYFSEEKIDCGYKCEKCKKKTKILKKLELALAPPILTIQFKRFKDNGSKLTTNIYYKHDLDLKTFASTNVMSEKWKYSLFAVAVHLGSSISGGHYVSYVKRNDKWYFCNDDSVNQCSESKVLNNDAYLLFYRQI